MPLYILGFLFVTLNYERFVFVFLLMWWWGYLFIRWSAIATHLPKRTDNEIKNYWNTHLKKRLTKMGIDPVTHKPKSDALSSIVAGQSTNLSHLAQWESARLEAEARLARESKLRSNTTSLIQKPKSGSSGLSGMASASSSTSALLLNKMATQPGAQALCFDVLRAWEGIKPKTTTVSGSIIGLGSNQYLESPTSTLNFSENSISIPHGNYSNGNTEFGVMKEECDHDHGDWKGYEKCVDDVVSAVDDQWRFEPLKIGDGQEPVMNFVDGFTDFILGHESDDPQDDHGNGNGDEFDHENKNYWNNIFNLMNTSPSESPVI